MPVEVVVEPVVIVFNEVEEVALLVITKLPSTPVGVSGIVKFMPLLTILLS